MSQDSPRHGLLWVLLGPGTPKVPQRILVRVPAVAGTLPGLVGLASLGLLCCTQIPAGSSSPAQRPPRLGLGLRLPIPRPFRSPAPVCSGPVGTQPQPLSASGTPGSPGRAVPCPGGVLGCPEGSSGPRSGLQPCRPCACRSWNISPQLGPWPHGQTGLDCAPWNPSSRRSPRTGEVATAQQSWLKVEGGGDDGGARQEGRASELHPQAAGPFPGLGPGSWLTPLCVFAMAGAASHRAPRALPRAKRLLCFLRCPAHPASRHRGLWGSCRPRVSGAACERGRQEVRVLPQGSGSAGSGRGGPHAELLVG